MRCLLAVILLAFGCCGDGAHLESCYANRTCDPGMICIWVRGHGTLCVVRDDVRVLDREGTYHFILGDGGAP